MSEDNFDNNLNESYDSEEEQNEHNDHKLGRPLAKPERSGANTADAQATELVLANDFKVTDLEKEPRKKKGSKPPQRHIKFHIIFNTNKSKWSLESHQFEELDAKITQACQTFFKEKMPKLYSLEEVADPGSFEDTPLEDRIISKKVEYIREIGPKKGLIHVHAVVSFCYRALKIQVNRVGIQKSFEKLLGMPIYCYIKTYRAAKENLHDYVRKTEVDKY